MQAPYLPLHSGLGDRDSEGQSTSQFKIDKIQKQRPRHSKLAPKYTLPQHSQNSILSPSSRFEDTN